ncbi:haloalkane dehalogenase [Nocardioides marinisabuli]|uniref:Haloalkane dehalogenase n=1 Tax=Nocardioides marinisabuli TaxID=419476 RepID=A0A7Y9F0N7_9ACTN|nr:haloalkane dehalogenase [Nocardioides marinisabuli]NYD56585.1 haloalkane dehalogenase [Nocardioides marinisabuli]
MKTLRTPDDRFADLPDFPWHPSYAELTDPDGGDEPVRMAYLDVGPEEGFDDAPVALLLHGEPTWSYLYRHVVGVLASAGVRCIVPDLIGFGRSDKPTRTEDHSYARHVEWVRELVVDDLDLRDVTLVGQDWGGLIGLRLVAEHPDRFARVVAANTGMPTGDFDMPEIWWQFRRAVENAPTLDVGRFVESGCVRGMSEQVRAAYDAPFPSQDLVAGPRAMPGLVPTSTDDPATEANRAAWEVLGRWEKPFLVAFSDSDPITGAMGPLMKKLVPGTREVEHPVIERAGHFLQEDAGAELGHAVADFIAAT